MLTWLARLFGFARGGAFDIHGGFGPLPTEAVQEKPVRHYSERVIAGMGSGDSSDVNTYAVFDKLPEAEKAGIKARSQLLRMRDRVMLNGIAPMDSAGGTRDELGDNPIPIDADAIADVMDRAYTRDPETKKLVLKDGLPVPDPDLEAGVTNRRVRVDCDSDYRYNWLCRVGGLMIAGLYHHWTLIFDVLKVSIGFVALFQIARVLRRLRRMR